MDLAVALTGMSGVLVTPFDDRGETAPKRRKSIIDTAVAAGVDVLTVNGNTSTFHSLTNGA